jgi:hypothetical protein
MLFTDCILHNKLTDSWVIKISLLIVYRELIAGFHVIHKNHRNAVWGECRRFGC